MDEETLGLASIGALALTEGVKFLYAQAGEFLKSWRNERTKTDGETASSSQSDTVDFRAAAEGILDQVPKDPVHIDLRRVSTLAEQLRALRRSLADWADEIEPVDTTDVEMLNHIRHLRASLELIIGQRLTFVGEHRSPSGTPAVFGSTEISRIAGYAAAVRIQNFQSGNVTGLLTADDVEGGGEAIAVDIRDLGRRA